MALGDKLPVVMGREKAAPSGVATLGADGVLTEAQRPGLAQIRGGSNPNLLLNWDFRNPVNRNGMAEYTINGYTLDRWTATNASVSLESGFIKLSKTNALASGRFRQPEEAVYKAGTTLTFSILARVNSVSGGRAVMRFSKGAELIGSYVSLLDTNGSFQLFTNTIILNEDVGNLYVEPFWTDAAATANVDVMAAKLELGPVQTLARQNETGEWEIIDPPDYDLQYLLCSQYSPITGQWAGSQHSNKNLLLNWDFHRPVNRNGMAEYTGVGYTIDRWRSNSTGTVLALTDNGIQASATGASDVYVVQRFESPLPTGTYTASALVFASDGSGLVQLIYEDGTYGPIKKITASGLFTLTATVPKRIRSMLLQINAGSRIIFQAAKLEPGSHQTLARQNEGGEWEIIDPHDYDLQYLLCSQYSPSTGEWVGSQHSNKNLLLNWDFRRPVNRNGKTEYTASGYTIDFWRCDFSQGYTGSVSITRSGIELSNSQTYLGCFMENLAEELLGKTFTFCLLTTAGCYRQSFTLPDVVEAEKQTIISVILGPVKLDVVAKGAANQLALQVHPVKAAGAILSAAKLELGPVQTLARQNADGVWEIIDPPDYDLQYLLCSQYSPSTGQWVGSQHSNKNLLDNWYFAGGGSQQGGGQLPINQRWKAEYAGVGYAIDRWQLSVARGKLTLNHGFITLTNTAASGAEYLRQSLEPDFHTGDVLTLTFFVRGNAQGQVFLGNRETGANIGAGTASFTASAEWQPVAITIKLGSTLPGYAVIQITGNGAYLDILAAKLEVGAVQSLAHKEGDTWVLNDPPPNYQQELAKCQRYQFKVEANSGRYAGSSRENINTVQMFIPTPVTPRANPSYPSGSIRLNVFTSTGAYSNVSCSIISALSIGDGILLTLTSDSALSGGTYRACVISILSSILLDFNL